MAVPHARVRARMRCRAGQEAVDRRILIVSKINLLPLSPSQNQLHIFKYCLVLKTKTSPTLPGLETETQTTGLEVPKKGVPRSDKGVFPLSHPQVPPRPHPVLSAVELPPQREKPAGLALLSV